MKAAGGALVDVDAALLRRWLLPDADAGADKEMRGTALVVAGSREMPGAALLAATASLRAGAGKLAVATGASIAAGVAVALPEARVVALAETKAGGLAARGLAQVEPLLADADVLVLGPGWIDEPASRAAARALLARAGAVPVVLDALAIGAAADIERFDSPVMLTPHAGEMAHLTGRDKETIRADPESHARQVAQRLNAVVVLKGSITFVAAPDGRCWRHAKEVAGLATSGSGDVLAGLVGGLIARGAELIQAAVWAVSLHARAGEALARRHGPLGYLARELAAEIPQLMHALRGEGAVPPLRPVHRP